LNFEFAKNYLLLKDYENALFFDEKILATNPDNIYVLEHIKKVYRAQHDVKNAIEIQKKIIALKPERKEKLIMLYVSDNQIDKAKEVYTELANKNQYITNAAYYKRRLFRSKAKETLHQLAKKGKTKRATEQVSNNTSVSSLKAQFKKNKKYAVLKQLLIEEEKLNQFTLVEEDAKSGLELFPAQPFLYFMQGKAANKLHKSNEAIEVLKAGLDFIIDNKVLQANFYEQLQKSYIALGNNKEATKYANKVLSLRK